MCHPYATACFDGLALQVAAPPAHLCAAGDAESNAGRVRLLGYRAGAPNVGLPARKSAFRQARLLRCKKSRWGVSRNAHVEQIWAAEPQEPDSSSGTQISPRYAKGRWIN
jgi:hypothetical protein